MALDRFRRAFTRIYLTADGRTLGVARIVLALVLLADLVRRIPWLRELYSNAGLVPNHTVLWQPAQPRMFSFFFMASHADEAAVGFVIAFICFFCLLIGFHTRLFHLLSFAMVTSLHERSIATENGGAVALNLLVLWTLFMPLDRRFSVDAVIRSLRARKDEGPEDLSHERRPTPDTRPFISLAVAGILLQLALVYWFNYVHKSGVTWRTGTAVHYVLQQERIVTILGVWARRLPFAVTQALTYGTLVIEGIAPFLLLTPVVWQPARALVIFLLTGLHGSIALLVNLGIFSAAMIAYYPLLLTSGHWAVLERLVPKRGRDRVVFYDADCGVCFLVVRILARLDVHWRLTWISNLDVTALPADVDPALLERTLLVVDPATGRRWIRSDGFAQIFAALPFGRLWAWLFLVPGIRQIAGIGYDAFARHRTAVSTWLGLSACAMPSVRQPSSGLTVEPQSSPLPGSDAPLTPPWATQLRALFPTLRELAVALTLFVLAADASVANSAMPRWLRWEHRPDWMVSAVMYPRVYEGWGMFAPEAPIYDEMVVVDAVTRDGRHVDPYNEVGSRVHALPVDDIPTRLDHDSFFCDYTLRIPNQPSYHQALLEWILRYPERTGDPRDALVSFEAIKLEHTPPGPGESHATNVRRTVFLRWPSAPKP